MHANVRRLGFILFCAILVVVCMASAGCISENTDIIRTDGYSSVEELADAVSSAIEPTNPAVRALALTAIQPQHGGSFNIDQVCDIYEYLYSHWTYVEDPKDVVDYFAKAGESAQLMKGDCDDFAILMVSCIEAIGGDARIIFARNAKNEGHAYAEAYLSNKKEKANEMIDQVSKRYGNDTVLAHWSPQWNKGVKYWLNLDWTSTHPGGEYFESTGDLVIVYPNGRYAVEGFNRG